MTTTAQDREGRAMNHHTRRILATLAGVDGHGRGGFASSRMIGSRLALQLKIVQRKLHWLGVKGFVENTARGRNSMWKATEAGLAYLATPESPNEAL